VPGISRNALWQAVAVLAAAGALAACSSHATGPSPTQPSAGGVASAGTEGSAATTGLGAPSPSASVKPFPNGAGVTDTALPLRAAFYYPWYPENFAGSGSHYLPSAGRYNGDDPTVVDRQIADMQYAGLQAGIASWWGRGKREDRRFALLLKEAEKLRFSWTVYYELEGSGDPSPATLSSDLAYLRRYTSSPAFLHVNGKAVIFAYGDGTDSCAMVDRWHNADTTGFFVVLKVFGGYRDCRNQPNGWHQYAPAGGLDVQNGYSAVCSPGFWKNDTATARLARDPARFRRDATTVATSKAPFQLVTTYNEWGEGTSVESTTDWPSPSGHGVYVDILHEVFGAHPR
jgi:glycosyl hydrolase family 99